MTSAYLNRPLRNEFDVRRAHLRVVPKIDPPPEPPTPKRELSLFIPLDVIVTFVVALFVAGFIAFFLGDHEGASTRQHLPQFVPMSEIARDYAFRGAFVELPDYPRWSEARL